MSGRVGTLRLLHRGYNIEILLSRYVQNYVNVWFILPDKVSRGAHCMLVFAKYVM